MQHHVLYVELNSKFGKCTISQHCTNREMSIVQRQQEKINHMFRPMPPVYGSKVETFQHVLCCFDGRA